MTNRDLDATWKYHNATKHSYASVRANPHALDWANKPLEYKMYPTLEITRLPDEAKPTGVPALKAICETVVPGKKLKAIPDLEILAQLLFLSAGITKAKKYPGGEIFFRAAACTGALYEMELYLACCDLPGLPAGVYHFGVAEFGLRQLRAGDYRRRIAEFAARDKSLLHAPVIVMCTGTYWRNAWKYQARTYRHFGWDNGTILANMLAVSAALKLPAKVIAGFADDPLNEFLGLDTQREVAFSMLALGYSKPEPPAVKNRAPKLDLPLLAPPTGEVDYPLMREMHAASSLASADQVSAWRKAVRSLGDAANRAQPELIKLPQVPEPEIPDGSIEEVIIRRGSTRKFAQASITLQQLSLLLRHGTCPIAADFLASDAHLNQLYLIINDVDGLAPGAYFYCQREHALESLRRGNFRKMAGYLGLEQELPAAASVCFFFLADLAAILERYGNRGYRIAQLEAGIMGGRLYLAAYAQRLGASGLTFYDNDVVSFFSPHAQGKSAIFLVAAGKSARVTA